MKLDDNKIIPVDQAEILYYINEKEVCECIIFQDDIWINQASMLTLFGNDELLLNNALSFAFSQGYADEKLSKKYYFKDGNSQSYMYEGTIYYDLGVVIAVAVKTQSEELLSYMKWARAMLNTCDRNDNSKLFYGKNQPFVTVRRVIHGEKDVVVPHKHNCYELVYYVKGEGKTSCESGSFDYKENTIFLVKPYELHEEYITEPSECLCLAFNTQFNLTTGVIYANEKNEATIKSIYKYLCETERCYFEENNMKEADNNVILVAYMLNKLFDGQKKIKRFSDTTVEYVKQYINLNYSYKINFTILSERIGYSLNHLNSLFKEKENMPLYAYLSNVRLKKAKDLLTESSIKISAISKKCGFSSVSRFAQFFKEKTGVSPQLYRKVGTNQVENGVLIAGKMKNK